MSMSLRRLVLVVAVVAGLALELQAQTRLRFLAGGGGGGGGGVTFDSGFNGSGTFSDGQSVTITRSAGSWGTKPTAAKPLYWWPFEADANPDATYSRTTSNPFTPDGSISTAKLATNQAGSFFKDLTVDGEPIFASGGAITFTSDDLYVWYRIYYDFTFSCPESFNLK